MKMKRTISTLLLAAGVAAAAAPVEAGQRTARGHWGETQAFRLQLGGFSPRGESSYWIDKEFDFTGDADDFNDAAVGLEYLRFLGNRVGLVVSGNFFEGSTDQAYLDFVDEDGFDIFHTTELEVAAFNLGLQLNLAARSAVIVPYVGAGGGLYAWRLSEFGDFIDFNGPQPFVFGDSFEEEGTTFGYYFQAGLEVPLADSVSLYGEARWQRAEDDLEEDFAGLGELDLSGRTFSAGVSWSF